MTMGNSKTCCLGMISICLMFAGCQTTDKSENRTSPNATLEKPAAVLAPKYMIGDTYRVAVTKSKRGTREFVRTYDGERGGNLIFLDEEGKEFALFTNDLNAVRIGTTQYIPNGGTLKFPMQVGNSWKHSYTHKSPKESRNRERQCSVKSWEPVQVIAGKFMAFRIYCSNQWSEATLPADEQYWYSPTTKSIVKYESREWYYENELKSYKLMK